LSDIALQLRILYVEDNPELRDVVSTILRGEGYDVWVAASAAEGLELLAARSYHLVISDYALPDHTGVWLLRQAKASGLLLETPAMLVTANPLPFDAGGVTVLQKPLELEDFLDRIDGLLAPRRRALVKRAEDAEPKADGSDGGTLIELALYVSSAAPSSVRAIRNAERLLLRYDRARVAFSVHDLAREVPEAAIADRVAFTPMLVKRRPRPRAWVLGPLDEPAAVAALLDAAGVARRE
jgi:CheY-like chemotaxis protein